jgi:hypothetical protein
MKAKHHVHPTHNADLQKQRDIVFSKFPPGQVPEAADDLAALQRLQAQERREKRAIEVGYNLADYTLAELEGHLVDKGYHLDNTLFSKLMRALIHYSEETQLRNLDAPERLIKKPHEAYVQAWEQHKHGDHDETPPEWREYK